MRLLHGRGVSPDLHSALASIAERLQSGRLVGVLPSTTVVVGNVDPLIFDELRGPIVGIPAERPRPGHGSALLAHSDVLAVLESGDLPADAGDRPVVTIGLPLPPPTQERRAIDGGGEFRAISDALHVEAGIAPDARSDHGVTWVSGSGSSAALRAVAAWRAGRAVIGIPGRRVPDLLIEAGCPQPADALAVMELTRLLLASPPLVRALAARGRRAAATATSSETVLKGLLEAAELAGQTKDVRLHTWRRSAS